jgi:alkanesulfonate monooxygenase SsuD/methylene tetrahydromethanopterin reductase-like flavin-dependent oxidoreductase (luciferase family)
VRFGVVILPDARWEEAADRWRRADELGFHSAWTYDHLSWRSLRDGPWFGMVPTLAASALVTQRVRLGPLVASPNFRHPVPLAKELMSLDDLSGGRLVVGLGAGGVGWDATVLGGPGWSPEERADRFEEFVGLLDQLLRSPADLTASGRFYAAVEARNLPGCVQQPRVPFAVAATGRRGFRLAASLGQAWVTTGDRTTEGPVGAAEGSAIVAGQIGRLEEACEAVGRDPASIDRVVLLGGELDQGLTSQEAFRDVAGRYAEVGVTDLVVHWPRPTEPYVADLATFERIFAGVGR